jgi:hypothetical protein
MLPKRLGSAFLVFLLIAAMSGCGSRSSNVVADEEPAVDALELKASSGAAFRASENVVPHDTVVTDRRLIIVNGERLELRRAKRPPRN